MEDLEKFEEMLKNHDWYYEYSDDHGVWQAGRRSKGEVMAELTRLKNTEMSQRAIELFEKYKKK